MGHCLLEQYDEQQNGFMVVVLQNGFMVVVGVVLYSHPLWNILSMENDVSELVEYEAR